MNKKMERVRWGQLAVLLACGAMFFNGCATGLGSQAGVQIDSEARAINLSWSKDHPWANDFSTQARAFQLHAQYRSGGRAVEQRFEAGNPTGPLSMRFALPIELRAPPESEVCLYIARSGGNSAVPVRAADSGNGDTARFRYPQWEEIVRRAATITASKQALVIAENRLSERQHELDRATSALQLRKVNDVSECKQSIPASAPMQRPVDVVEPAQQSMAAKKVCVLRSLNMPTVLLDLIVEIVNKHPQDLTPRMREQLVRFTSDFKEWADKVKAGYVPEIGTPKDGLPIVGTVEETAVKYLKEADARTIDNLRSIVAGMLDGYDGCLEDATKQIRVKYEAWQRAAENKPMRDKLFAEREQGVCLKLFDQRQLATQTLNEVQAEVSAAKAALHKEMSVAESALPNGRRLVNDNRCNL